MDDTELSAQFARLWKEVTKIALLQERHKVLFEQSEQLEPKIERLVDMLNEIKTQVEVSRIKIYAIVAAISLVITGIITPVIVAIILSVLKGSGVGQ